MNEPSDNPNPPPSCDKEMAWSRFWIFIGLFPFLPSFALAMAIGKPKLFLAPLYGFCPMDVFHVHSSPPTEQILLWGCASAIICVAFAIYAFFVKPFGIFFAMGMWASSIGLLFRIGELLKAIH